MYKKTLFYVFSCCLLIYCVGSLILSCLDNRRRTLELRRRTLELRRRQTHNNSNMNTVFPDVDSEFDDTGLAPDMLDALPVITFSGEDTAEQFPPACIVCLSDFEKREKIRLLPKCNHVFHVDCIDMWFYSHSKCPLCRSAVVDGVVPNGGSTMPFGDATDDNDGNETSECSPRTWLAAAAGRLLFRSLEEPPAVQTAAPYVDIELGRTLERASSA